MLLDALRVLKQSILLLLLVVTFIALTGIHAGVGPVSLLGVVGFIGLLSIVAGGGFAIVAIIRRRERSILVLATLPVWVLAVVLLVVELTLHH